MLDKGIKVKVTKQPAVNRLHKLKEHLLTWWVGAYKKRQKRSRRLGPTKATKEKLKKQKILIYFPVLFMWRLKSTTLWFHRVAYSISITTHKGHLLGICSKLL